MFFACRMLSFDLWSNWVLHFTIHDPTIHDPMMSDSCKNYPNKFKLCRENGATEKQVFAEQKAKLLLYANKYFSTTSRGISQCWSNWLIFIKLLNRWSSFFCNSSRASQKKSNREPERKTTEAALENRYFKKFCKIYRKAPAQKSKETPVQVCWCSKVSHDLYQKLWMGTIFGLGTCKIVYISYWWNLQLDLVSVLIKYFQEFCDFPIFNKDTFL